jgi:hypothetical protein
MIMKRPLLALTGLSLLVGLSHCSDDSALQYIKVPDFRKTSLTVGQSHDLTIALATPVEATSYVDIKNEYTEFVGVVEPASLVIKYRAAERTKTVTLKGLKPTPNFGYVPITFSIRDSNESLTLEFQVRNSVTPDFGIPPDYGPDPDIGVKDTGTTVDKGTAADKGTTVDATTTADAATAD